jgi:hypothetical protein
MDPGLVEAIQNSFDLIRHNGNPTRSHPNIALTLHGPDKHKGMPSFRGNQNPNLLKTLFPIESRDQIFRVESSTCLDLSFPVAKTINAAHLAPQILEAASSRARKSSDSFTETKVRRPTLIGLTTPDENNL